MIGSKVGSYTIEREIGRGGMGAVYVATHALLGRKAAIKVLLPAMSRDDLVQRFFNEARAATAIKHPGIVEVFDYGVGDDGSAFIVMELLEGESLASRLRRLGPVSSEFALAVTKHIASALGAAHRAGIVHRDLKPDNVFLVADPDVPMGERIKLLDFGIAKLVSPDGKLDMALTHTGALMGTPHYMSPEQCRGAGLVDARSDLYSLGCMLFEMVAGRVPFVGEGVGEIIAAHIHVQPAAPRSLAPELAPEVEGLILRLLAKSPADRPASADALLDELTGVAAAPRARPRMSDAPPLAGEGPPPVVVSPPTSPTASERSSWPAAKRSRARPALLVGGAAVAAAAVTFVVSSRRDSEPQRVASPSVDASIDSSLIAILDDARVADPPPPPDAAVVVDAEIARRHTEPTRRVRHERVAEPVTQPTSTGASTGTSAGPGPSWPTPTPPKWIAELTFAPITVSEQSEYQSIADGYESRKSGIRYCYGDLYHHGKEIAGAKVSITMTVPLGREYAKATVTGGDAISARCVRAVLQGVTWAPLKTSAPVIMKTSFTVAIH